MLNSVEWRYFKLGDLFEINLGKHKKRDELSPKPVKGKDVPHITSSSMNNGVDGYSSESNAKNVITIGTRGSNFAFYHKSCIFASGNVAILDIKNNSITMSEHKALFITVIINNEQYRWSYGFNPTLTRLKRLEIKLPINSNGEANWDFMEEYIKKLSEGNLEGFNLPKKDVRLSLDDREWDEFKLEDLFEIYSSTNLTTNVSKKMNKGDIFHVIRSHENNMTTNKRLSIKDLNERKIKVNVGNKIVVGAESFSVSYQANQFVVGRGINILENKNLNKYNSLFVMSVIRKNSYKCSYGRAYYASRLKSTIIKLPIKAKSSSDEKSEVDWEFMENYIKGLPYTSKL